MPKKKPDFPDEDSFVIVLETVNPATVAIAKSLLEEEDIPFIPLGDALQGVLMQPFAGTIRIQVRKSDAPKALELLKDIV